MLFQKMVDTILQGKKKVICYIDEILVTGENEQEHISNLAEVFECLKEHGIRVKKEKCEFLVNCVKFLGYKIDAKGIHADPAKLAAITEAPRPSNQQQLKSFLGLIQYYGKFIPNLSALLNPLHYPLKAKQNGSGVLSAIGHLKKPKRSLVQHPYWLIIILHSH